MNSLKASTTSRGVDMVRVNASQETRAMTHGQDHDEDQSHCYSSLETLPILSAEGSQQPLWINRNAGRRQRHRARYQQAEEAVVAICATGTKHESYQTCVFVPKRETQPRISQAEAENHIQQTRVSVPKHEVHVSLPRRETCVQHVAMPKREHETRVQLRFALACKVRVQPPKAKKNAELESPHSHGFEASSSIPLQWIWETTWQRRWVFIKSLSNAAVNDSSWQYFSNVTTVLVASRQYSTGWHSPSLQFNQKASLRRKRTFTDMEYLEMTSNIVDPSTMPSKSRGGNWPLARMNLAMNFLLIWEKY